MRVVPIIALALAAVLTMAAAPSDLLTIGGEAFPQSDILDARAIADATGKPTIYVTLTPSAAKRLATVSQASVGKAIAIAVGGKTLGDPMITAPTDGGAIEISGLASFDAAVVMAHRVSGKSPLPESMED